MDSFEICNSKGLQVIFSAPQFSDEGWLDNYLLSIAGNGVNADIRVENPPYGHSPYILLKQMSKEWNGWKDPKEWGAMEGEFCINATYKVTGHIMLSFEINDVSNGWDVIANIDVEAGQLESLACEAKEFFGC